MCQTQLYMDHTAVYARPIWRIYAAPTVFIYHKAQNMAAANILALADIADDSNFPYKFFYLW
jgi:hypothetical protein